MIMSSNFNKINATQENKASAKNGVRRLVFVGIAMLLEIILDLGLMLWLNQYDEWITVFFHIIAAILVLVIYNQNKTSAMKIPWIILIMALPILGMTAYALIGLNPGMHSMKKRYNDIDQQILPLLSHDPGTFMFTDDEMTDEQPEKDDETIDTLLEKDDEVIDEMLEETKAETSNILPVSSGAETADISPDGAVVEPAAVTVVEPAADRRDASGMTLSDHIDQAEEHLREIDPGAANIATYLNKRAQFPAYENIEIEYYDDAAKGIEAQKEEFRKAQKFIFMEYHAIENAESWHAIQEILEERVNAGVEVRVFYDDMGSIGFIDTDFVKLMESKGIQCRVFNPFKIGLNLFLNNRDHRKIMVVDGHVGFTGGYNIANEYFNITHPFGYWKDTGIKIYGPAVRSLTVMFLEMWNAVNSEDANDTDYDKYLQDVTLNDPSPVAMPVSTDAAAASTETAAADQNDSNASTETDVPDADDAARRGFVIPYGDMPLDDEHVGEDVYISMAEYARKYVWYVTPYLILTDEMIHALGLAAKRGVDVRVITPGIPDKPTVYSMTRSYYQSLVRNGVRIYEYTPGFCHCKMSVADDNLAVCGTINLDYRSLYHHFENACLYGYCKAVQDTKADFDSMIAQSREVTDEYKSPTAGKALGQMILRLVAPLM